MNNAVMIESNRTGYTTKQCGRTFTVGGADRISGTV